MFKFNNSRRIPKFYCQPHSNCCCKQQNHRYMHRPCGCLFLHLWVPWSIDFVVRNFVTIWIVLVMSCVHVLRLCICLFFLSRLSDFQYKSFAGYANVSERGTCSFINLRTDSKCAYVSHRQSHVWVVPHLSLTEYPNKKQSERVIADW